MTKEELKEFLKTVKDAGFELGDVEVNVVTVKGKDAKAPQEEPKPEPTKEPAHEKAAAMIQANIRFAKAMKDAASEFYQLSCLAGEILNENQKLRARLGEK